MVRDGLVNADLRRGQGHRKKRYRNFVEPVENIKIENPSDDVLGGVVLGRVDFVNWVKNTFLSMDSSSKEIPN